MGYHKLKVDGPEGLGYLKLKYLYVFSFVKITFFFSQDIADKKKRESTISLSVKSALESFDFLNEVEEQNNSDCEDSGSGSMEE